MVELYEFQFLAQRTLGSLQFLERAVQVVVDGLFASHPQVRFLGRRQELGQRLGLSKGLGRLLVVAHQLPLAVIHVAHVPVGTVGGRGGVTLMVGLHT